MLLLLLCTEKSITRLDSEFNKKQVQGVKHLLGSIFLPQGYPFSVSEDYLSYQIWDTVQVCLASFATHAFLPYTAFP